MKVGLLLSELCAPISKRPKSMCPYDCPVAALTTVFLLRAVLEETELTTVYASSSSFFSFFLLGLGGGGRRGGGGGGGGSPQDKGLSDVGSSRPTGKFVEQETSYTEARVDIGPCSNPRK